MAGMALSMVVLLALIGGSSAQFCLCRDEAGSSAMQKAMDYACANGANCQAIQPNGACYQPNTVKSHCDYAVNSYYQNKRSMGGTCDFSGVASTSQSTSSNQLGSCVYPTSSSGTTTGTPTTAGVPTMVPPATTGMTPGTTTTTTPAGIVPGSLGPSVNGFGGTDTSDSAAVGCVSSLLLLGVAIAHALA